MRLGDWRDMTSLHNVRLKILLSSIANESTADTISLPLAGNSVGLGESDACTLSLLLLGVHTPLHTLSLSSTFRALSNKCQRSRNC